MANRSDFFNAKLPRGFKRMLAMEEANGWIKDNHERGVVKRAYMNAHADHVSFKLKRHSTDRRDTAELND